MGKRPVLITGSLGFVGSHLHDRYVSEGWDVVGIDNGSRPCRAPGPREVLIRRSVGQALNEWRREETPELIVHCAAPVGAAAMKPETKTLWQIVRDAHAVFEAATRWGSRVIAFSSPEIYGWGDGTPFDEAVHLEVHPPYNPRYEYPIGKMAMECMGMAGTVPFVHFLRPYNMAGPGQNPAGGFVLARFVDLVKRGQPITIFGDGSQRRQFIHIDDVVDFVMRLSDGKWDNQPDFLGAKGIWNLANPDSIVTMNELARMVIEAHGEGTVEYADPKVALGNPHYVEAPEKFVDVGKALTTGWRPTCSLDQIIEEMLEHAPIAATRA